MSSFFDRRDHEMISSKYFDTKKKKKKKEIHFQVHFELFIFIYQHLKTISSAKKTNKTFPKKSFLETKIQDQNFS